LPGRHCHPVRGKPPEGGGMKGSRLARVSLLNYAALRIAKT
jgi:hypothetical protein